jgi:hypothetical protein
MFDSACVQLGGFVASASCRLSDRISSNRLLTSRMMAAMASKLPDSSRSGKTWVTQLKSRRHEREGHCEEIIRTN